MILSRACLATIAVCIAAYGCSSSDGSVTDTPAGVTCANKRPASDATSLGSGLASAAAGDCVVLQPNVTYAGTFTVPPGVTLSGPAGARAILKPSDPKAPVVALGEKSGLAGLDVADAGVAIAVHAASASISDVHVSGAKIAALAVLCTSNCAQSTVTIANANLETSELGLWVSGAHVAMTGGRSGGHLGTGISSGDGIVATGGATIELDGVTVDGNQGTGVLVDGAGTTASIKNATIQENANRGVWAQGLTGTLDAPALRVESSTLVRNKIVGLGSIESRGIIIIGGRVAETQNTPVSTTVRALDQVGDGFGIFKNTTDFKIDGTVVEQNDRAAGLVDDGTKQGIIIIGGTIAAGASGYKIVVQETDESVLQIATGDRSTTPDALGVSAPQITVPPAL
ncbi:MAG TPA: right-handed parallel beta-helix repeat-containing protein [Labilithrix sp.]